MKKLCAGVIQMALKTETSRTPDEIRRQMLKAYAPLIERAASNGVQVLCFQELFNQPFFCASGEEKWFAAAESIARGPTIRLMQDYARQFAMVIVAPIYEKTDRGQLFNSAAVIDADGKHLGTYRKVHIPEVTCSEKFYFESGNNGFPVFETAYCRLGVYICYDRHFPEGWRVMAIKGADYVVNPSSTPSSQATWKIEQPAQAIANSFFVAAINRVGIEKPWDIGRFYGSSYFANPKGAIIAEAGEFEDELLIADLDFGLLTETREMFQFLRERRPEEYQALIANKVVSCGTASLIDRRGGRPTDSH